MTKSATDTNLRKVYFRFDFGDVSEGESSKVDKHEMTSIDRYILHCELDVKGQFTTFSLAQKPFTCLEWWKQRYNETHTGR